MTNAELIAKLQQLPPNDAATVTVRIFSKAFPVAYVHPFDVSNGRICVALPEGMHTVTRKTGK